MKIRNITVLNKREALEEISRIGAESTGCRLMAPKAVHRLIKIYGLSPKQATILKQEMLSKGGEAAVARGVLDSSAQSSEVILMGTLRQMEELISKLKMQPFGLPALGRQIKQVLDNLEGRPVFDLDCRGKKVTIGNRTLVMGILNVTPDSFSDGGKYYDPGMALERALGMVEEGADIIDLGGESTRPGYAPVEPEEELKRILPVLKRLVRDIPVPLSVDTCKSLVAEAALEEGAHIINDQWALRQDHRMAEVVARHGAPLILMHNQKGTAYRELMGDMIDFFNDSIDRGMEAGIPRDKMIVDPGIGFGKTPEQNIEVMGRLKELECLGLPVLIGTSRKSLIGKVLDLPVDQRLEGTAATVSVGIANGADIIRVHDVKEMSRVARMTDAMVRRKI
ncbi:dihydropteroate synthase [Desulfocucumis palustris]|uniref:Dihydropteroate synthase n=1 Tax=Desulfocucumis palustris TaxID=1898651 RepID=A0A2L2X804_9FIRM|nr:dihydropteroate synthase [Desulfocucumis palustris]GBF32122.1 dihydropteroate synthase [Desulfocucumis palustris]